MCGIAGIIAFEQGSIDQVQLKEMTDVIQHRGPDGEGFWMNEERTVGFGHRRLSIIDLSNAAAQPMHYHDRYTIVYNGEIYNYIEVKNTLQQKGYAFNSQSDTEVILAAYACYGSDCLQYFDGMFAFVIWDSQEQVLFCARDRFGEKPFYFSTLGGRFLFASEMKALWAAGIQKKMKPDRLLRYIAWGSTSDPFDESLTFFENIQCLPGGHYLTVEYGNQSTNGSLSYRVQSYWDLDKETTSSISEADAQSRLLHLLQTSVSRRLRSDVAVGTSLSGGLDSSTIAALIHDIQQASPQKHLQTFSAVFPGFINDESAHIKSITEAFQFKNFTTSPTAASLVNDLQKLMYHQEEPFQSSSIYAQYKVYELAKEHGVTVLLDGQGADETMAGYHNYYHWYWQELLAAFDFKKCKAEIAQARRNGVTNSWDYKNIIAAFMPGVATNFLEERAMRQMSAHPDFNAAFVNDHKGLKVSKPAIRHLNDILYFNTRQSGLKELLRYADRNSMAHSREIRLPFLSHELVEFVFSLPSDYKIKKGYTKWILRDTMKNHLPESIAWRKDKVGFEPPQQQWMHEPIMTEVLHESKKKLVSNGVLSPAVLNKRVQATPAHHKDSFDWRYLCAAGCL